MYGLFEQGFRRKRYADLLESMEQNARQLFGENVNLSERSPLGMFIRVIAFPISQLWELGENVYYSAFVSSAESIHLDRVANNIGITRQLATNSRGKITVFGEPGVLVPLGFRVQTQKGITFETEIADSIKSSGQVVINIISIGKGAENNVGINTINEIINPIAGIHSVTNVTTTGGRDIETDVEFRSRYDRSLSSGGAATREAIEAALLDVEGVLDAIVEANESMSNVNGVPPKSIAPFVSGGDNEQIAKAILRTKAFGIKSHGAIHVSVEDSRGNEHIISFSRPQNVTIDVKVTLIKNEHFSPDGLRQIRQAIVEYIGGVDENLVHHRGLGVGQDVIRTRIVGLAHVVDGVEDVAVQLSRDGNWPVAGNIAIGNLEVAYTSFQLVVVR